MATWRFIAQDLLSGTFLHWDLPLTTDGPSWDLSGPGALAGTLNPQAANLLDSTGAPLLQEWSTAVYAEADGTIRWGGILVRSTFNASEWTIECSGFTSYPAGIPYTGSYWAKIQWDPTDIFRAIWDHLQTQPDGNLGVQYVLPTNCPVRVGIAEIPGYTTYLAKDGKYYTADQMPANSPIIKNATSASATTLTATATVVTLTKLDQFGQVPAGSIIHIGMEDVKLISRSGLKLTVQRAQNSTTATAHSLKVGVVFDGGTQVQTVDPIPAEPYVLTWWEATDCGQEIDKLAQETPFDYSEEHWWQDDGTIGHRVRVDYPRLGRKRPELAFVQGINVTTVVQVARNGDNFANIVYGVGKGEGAATLRSEVATRDGRLRRPYVYTDKSVGSTSRLSSLAREEHVRRQLLPAVASITVVDHPNARIGSWNIGDDILIRCDLPWLGYQEIWSRVTSWQMLGESRATLTVARSDTFNYGAVPQT